MSGALPFIQSVNNYFFFAFLAAFLAAGFFAAFFAFMVFFLPLVTRVK
jgi:hypothetical protein